VETELIARTSLTDEEIGEYSGNARNRPSHRTYQVNPAHQGNIGTWNCSTAATGPIIYDEVHLLPAPLFRMTAICSRGGDSADRHADPRGRPRGRRVQLDRAKRYDAPWKTSSTGLDRAPSVSRCGDDDHNERISMPLPNRRALQTLFTLHSKIACEVILERIPATRRW